MLILKINLNTTELNTIEIKRGGREEASEGGREGGRRERSKGRRELLGDINKTGIESQRCECLKSDRGSSDHIIPTDSALAPTELGFHEDPQMLQSTHLHVPSAW